MTHIIFPAMCMDFKSRPKRRNWLVVTRLWWVPGHRGSTVPFYTESFQSPENPGSEKGLASWGRALYLCIPKLIFFFSRMCWYFPASLPCSWMGPCDWVLANGTWADGISTTPRPARCKPLIHTPHALSLSISRMSSRSITLGPQVKGGRFAF